MKILAVLLILSLAVPAPSPQSIPYVGTPRCLEGSQVLIPMGWLEPPADPNTVHAVVNLYDGESEVVGEFVYIGQIGEYHYWYVILPMPYPAHWLADVRVRISGFITTVDNNHRRANCDIFLPVLEV